MFPGCRLRTTVAVIVCSFGSRFPLIHCFIGGILLSLNMLFDETAFGPWFADPAFVEMRSLVAAVEESLLEEDILELCAGLGTGYLADCCLGKKVRLAGYYDIDVNLLPWLRKLHGDALVGVHCGVSGDILQIRCSRFPRATKIIVGAPCLPWSMKGSRDSWNDDRSIVFRKCLQVIVHQASNQHLREFVLENVMGMVPEIDGASPLAEQIGWLIEKLGPEWTVKRFFVNSIDFCLPQNRPRVYVIGVKGGTGPLTMPSFATRAHFGHCMDANTPSPVQSYTNGTLLQNLFDYKIWLQEAMNNKKLLGEFAVFAVDRTPSSRTGWTVSKRISTCECLTTNGPALHILSLGEGCDVTRKSVQLTADRPASPSERGRLQGFPEWFVDINTLYEAAALVAFGNAMSVPVLASGSFAAFSRRLNLPPLRCLCKTLLQKITRFGLLQKLVVSLSASFAIIAGSSG